MNKVSKTPRLLAKLAKAHNKNQQGLTAGAGMKIIKTRGRTLIVRKTVAAEEGLTQAEFNDMFLVALTDGAIDSALNDLAYDAAIDAIFSTFGFLDVDVCGIGTRTFAIW